VKQGEIIAISAFMIIALGIAFALGGPGTKPWIAWNCGALQRCEQSPQQSTITRIDQTSQSQYINQQEYNTWYQSACSAAAITEVLNALGGHYTIHDALSAEINAQQISPEAGMLNGFTSIQQTVNALGYQASQVYGGIDGIVSTANAGIPVLVSMQSSDWPGGHILVVTGGDGSTINIIDSWTTNRTSFSRADFAHHWTGLAAKVVRP